MKEERKHSNQNQQLTGADSVTNILAVALRHLADDLACCVCD